VVRPGLVLEILFAELILSPNYTAAGDQIKKDRGLAMRFPRFTGRWRDDKPPEDALRERAARRGRDQGAV
jgi:DNA ligase 1